MLEETSTPRRNGFFLEGAGIDIGSGTGRETPNRLGRFSSIAHRTTQLQESHDRGNYWDDWVAFCLSTTWMVSLLRKQPVTNQPSS